MQVSCTNQKDLKRYKVMQERSLTCDFFLENQLRCRNVLTDLSHASILVNSFVIDQMGSYCGVTGALASVTTGSS